MCRWCGPSRTTSSNTGSTSLTRSSECLNHSSPSLATIISVGAVVRFAIRIYDVTDKKLLYTSEKSIRKNVQVEERFDIKIPRAKRL
jgi:hypothetical protein